MAPLRNVTALLAAAAERLGPIAADAGGSIRWTVCDSLVPAQVAAAVDVATLEGTLRRNITSFYLVLQHAGRAMIRSGAAGPHAHRRDHRDARRRHRDGRVHGAAADRTARRGGGRRGCDPLLLRTGVVVDDGPAPRDRRRHMLRRFPDLTPWYRERLGDEGMDQLGG